jgi:single-stranded-DNA-specific exonuclease
MPMKGIRANWTLKDTACPTGSGVDALYARILAARGGIKQLGVQELPATDTLPGATEAAQRIVSAVENGQRIAIHGDYDADGITGSIILHSVLKVIAPTLDVPIKIPHRINDGYGLSEAGLLELRAQGIDLVVSVDCGITSVGEVEAAHAVGLEVIITDHHEFLPEGLLPQGIVVHPRLPGATCYPWLAGAGVAWTLACAIAKAHCNSENIPTVLRTTMAQAMAFAAIGTIADVVELRGENRMLAKGGLERLAKTPNLGLQALLKECGAVGPISEELIKFQLAPRLNALGRLGSAQKAIELFQTTDPKEAVKLAKEISAVNMKRRALQDAMVEQACAMVEGDPAVVVLGHPSWKQGLCGPAASKVAERFNCPVVLLQECDGGIAKGSARSIEGVSIRDGLVECQDLLERFGGHAAAAGLTLKTSLVGSLRVALEAYFSTVERAAASIAVDCRSSLEEVGSRHALRAMGELAPFGPGNPEPRVLLEGVRVVQTKWIGADKTHLKLQLTDSNKRTVDAVWFRAAEHREAIEEAFRFEVNLVAEPGINSFNGYATPQLRIVDLGIPHNVTEEPAAISGTSVPARSAASRAVDA